MMVYITIIFACTLLQNIYNQVVLNLSRFRKIEFEMTTLAPPIDETSENITLCDAEGNIIGVQESDIYKYDYEMIYLKSDTMF